MSIQALRERRNHLVGEAQKLMADTKDKSWTAENDARYSELTGQVVDLDSRITREQKVLDLAAENEFTDIDALRGKGPANSEPLSERGIMNTWMRGGDKALSAEQAQKIANTMSTGTGSEGGYTVQSEVAKTLVDSLKAYGGLRLVATVLQTSGFGPMAFPTTDGTNEEGELLAENAPATDSDPTFGTVSLTPYKFGSKVIAVPLELLQDSSVDIEAFVNARIQTRIGRITEKLFAIGTGSGQPNGITVAASVGKTGITGQTTTVIYDDLVDLLESVDDAYQMNGKFMMHQNIRKVLRKLKDTAGRPIWTPGYEYGITENAPDLLLGKSVIINNSMPAPAANAKSIAYGDFSKYVIRDAMNVSLFRFADSAYIKKGQIGFLAWMRCGGNLTDTAAVKTYVHSAT